MAGKKNKVKFNIQNVYYAKKTDEGYETPAAIPGAVSISLEQQGELSAFYADGVKYYVSSSNGGYEGDLEVALIPDEFRKGILGEIEDKNKVLIENANAVKTEFALGFQIDGDTTPTLFWFYNCTATRPNVESNTTEDSVEVATDKLTISCAADADGNIRAKTTPDSYETVKGKWFKEVYKKDASVAQG